MSLPSSTVQASLPNFVCPSCHGSLSLTSARRCDACNMVFPVHQGILDFRPKHERTHYFDDAAADEYAAVNDALAEQHEGFMHAAETRGSHDWSEVVTACGIDPVASQIGVEIGCGSGGMLTAMAETAAGVIGLDVSLTLLLEARKRIEQAGVSDRVCLVLASAAYLPLPSDSVRFVAGMHVIEHVDDQHALISEAHRILMPGGLAYFDSPNRFTIMPEPHVLLRFVSWLPRRWADPYTRWRTAGKFDYIGKRLLSYFELRRKMKDVFRGAVVIHPAPLLVPPPGKPETARLRRGRRYADKAMRFPIARLALYLIVPRYSVAARKSV